MELNEEQAQEMRDKYFRKFSGLRRWHQKQGRQSSTRTLVGRRRVWNRGEPPFTQLINSPVQGSGADGLKLALALLWQRKAECPEAFPILAVHDEIVIEAPANKAEEAREWLVQCMVDGMAQILREVPVVVETQINQSWA